ncbi:MAG: polyribonucleotide nucleotidyltransferase [Spirochaetia bacterium]|nr:polyribonucleotide nucleotidyltransferase [Spirochaetia bacterium]
MPQVTINIGGKDLILETGKLAKQANGAVFATYAGSSVLATVCCSEDTIEGLDYVPLQVEYNEKYYAAGKIPGGFLKREGKPKDKEILVSRLIDRPMRPLFYKEFKRDIQVVPTVVSADQITPPDVIAMIASSAAVVVSDIPYNGPAAAVRVCYLNGEYIINPTFEQIEQADMEIVVAGIKDGITMVEGGAKEVSEDVMLEAIDRGSKVVAEICKVQEELRALAGKEKLPLPPSEEETFAYYDKVWEYAYEDYKKACFLSSKVARNKGKAAVKAATVAHFKEEIPEEEIGKIGAVFEDLEYKILRTSILENNLRCDGRIPTQIRPITCEVGLLAKTHGSSLFTRGETQSLSTCTLGTEADEQMFDDIDGAKRYSNFMLHYNFPPFSVGETGKLTTGRREIGHGNLAQRSLSAVIPPKADFPYTIRVVSEIVESNGSSSMATVCAGTLALMDAGVPIRKPVAGIAMGLITEGEKTVILSDILGEEDHFGDMDFKVAGTRDGITGFQMDIKIAGVSKEIMKRALAQANAGRMHILGIMCNTISEPRTAVSANAPQIVQMKIDVDKIGAVIGTGGKNIKSIADKSEADVNIDDFGNVKIYGKNLEKALIAKAMVESFIEKPEVGKVYNGVVKRITEFGAFIEFLPGKEGLCHISKLSKERVENVTDVLKEGQEIPVKLVEIDRMGRLNLSYIEAIDPDYVPPKQERAPRGGRDGGRDRDRERDGKERFRRRSFDADKSSDKPADKAENV